MNTRYLSLALLLGANALVIVLSVGWVASLFRLNQYALQTGRLMVAQDIAPGWWLNQDAMLSCNLPSSVFSDDDMVDARLERLYGLQALVCGEFEPGEASLTATADRLPSDPTVSLILAKDEAGGASASPMGANTLAERARQAYADGDREAAANWLDMGKGLLDETSQYDNQSYYFAACYVYRGLSRLDDSLKACQQYTDVKPNDKEAWNHLGATYMALKDWPQAETALRIAMGLDENSLPAQENILTVLFRQGQEDAALRIYADAKRRADDSGWSDYYLARMALQLQRCEEALTYLQNSEAANIAALQSALDRLHKNLGDACQ